jgi:hypothetical protein
VSRNKLHQARTHHLNPKTPSNGFGSSQFHHYSYSTANLASSQLSDHDLMTIIFFEKWYSAPHLNKSPPRIQKDALNRLLQSAAETQPTLPNVATVSASLPYLGLARSPTAGTMAKPSEQPPSDMEVDAASEEKPLVKFSINGELYPSSVPRSDRRFCSSDPALPPQCWSSCGRRRCSTVSARATTRGTGS